MLYFNFISLGGLWGCVGPILLGLILSFDLPQSGALYIQPASMKTNPTILSSMKRDFTAAFGSCSFPPEEVLSDLTSFGFLEKCNVPLPKPEASLRSHPDAEVLLCMALYDIGLRICGEVNMTDDKQLMNRLPHNAVELQKVLNEGRPRPTGVQLDKQSDLCSSLQTVLYEPTATQTKDWNLKITFQTKKNACNKICFDYDDAENEFCKLILWGSNMLREAKSFVDYPVRRPNQTLIIGSELGPRPITNSSNVSYTNSHVNPKRPEIQNLDSQPIFSNTAEFNDKTNTPELVPSIHNYGVNQSPGMDENNMNVGDDYRNGEYHVAEENLKSSSTGSSDIGRDKLPVNIQEQFLTSESLDGKKYDSNNIQRRPTSNSGIKSSDIDTHKQAADGTSPGKLSSETITSSEKNAIENAKTLQSSKTLIGQQASSSFNSTSTRTSTVESVAVGVAQESYQKPEVEGNQEMGSDEFTNEDPPLDQGEDGDDLNFPNTDLDQPEKTETSVDNYFKTSRDEITNGNVYVRDRFEGSEDSHFFGYFLTMIIFFIVGYLVFHNKQKIFALAVEGRSRRSTRRRPNTANYHKLDSNLEEAVSSPCNTSVTHVIY